MRWMRDLALFLAGTLVSMLFAQVRAAPRDDVTGPRLNHVGMSVKDLDQSVDFYTKIMGFRKAFSVRDNEGKLLSIHIQISRDTFLELSQADADNPVGFSHAAIAVDDVNATIAGLRQRGLKVDDSHVGFTKARMTRIVDPSGLQVELIQLTPESLQMKAIDSW